MIGAAALAAAPVAGLSLLTAAPAGAHDVLVSSSPEDGSTTTQPPAAVELTFSGAVQDQFTQVAILGAGDASYEQGDPEVVGPTVTQAVDDLPDGEYTVSYRVVSSDGHPVSGTISFTVAASGEGAAGPETAEPESPTTPEDTTTPDRSSEDTPVPSIAPAAGNTDDGIGTLGVILVVVVAAVAVAGIAFVAVGGWGRGSARDTES